MPSSGPSSGWSSMCMAQGTNLTCNPRMPSSGPSSSRSSMCMAQADHKLHNLISIWMKTKVLALGSDDAGILLQVLNPH
ncbi:hypothetical protein RRG08_001907 [Elysia crispata]|uniref:Uncharacterized protein n=1 Tax=Elysia crispata TaxID=231223 RepID=A0AAE1A345_9GAST|nr:hypothetical protein RRG08_001907 [Elysia crispata]